MDQGAVLAEDRQVDPRQIVPEPGAPDHVRHVEHLAVLEDRSAVHRPRRSCPRAARRRPRAASASRGPAGRPGWRSCAGLPTDRRAEREHVACGEHDQADRDETGERCRRCPRGRGRGRARQPGRVRAHELERDVAARVAGTHDEHAALTELRRVAVLGRVQLHDRGIEVARDRRGRAARRCAPEATITFIGFEPVVAGRDDVAVALAPNAVHADPGPRRGARTARRTTRGSRPSRPSSA